MSRYFIRLSYKGTRFNGWQVQDNTPHTVQQVLQDSLGRLLNETLDITGCGRTDTGVHASEFFAHFDSPHPQLQADPGHWLYKFNQVLPPDVAIQEIYRMQDTAHSRFDALQRTYEYYIHRDKDPFLNEVSYHWSGPLDLEAMNRAAAHLLDVRDFTSFSKVNTQTKTNNCRLTEARWESHEGGHLVFRISADRFLRNMVRAIVGTLLEVGKHKLSQEAFQQIVASKNRSDAGMSAPAHALFLKRIIYPKTIFLEPEYNTQEK